MNSQSLKKVGSIFLYPIKLILTSIGFLTIVPTGGMAEAKDLRRSMIFFPLTGCLIGGLLCTIYLPLASQFTVFGFHGVLLAFLSIAIWIIITGALHIDGLADCCDGLLGGRTKEERLAILKKGNIGTFGVTAIVLLILGKIILLFYILTYPSKELVVFTLLSIPMFGRWSLVVVGKFSRSATKGLGHTFSNKVSLAVLIGATVLPLVALLYKFPNLTIIFFIVTILISAITILFSKWRIGGVTGDVFGASCEITELALLFSLTILLLSDSTLIHVPPI